MQEIGNESFSKRAVANIEKTIEMIVYIGGCLWQKNCMECKVSMRSGDKVEFDISDWWQ